MSFLPKKHFLQKGFTFLEMVVVVCIIMVVAIAALTVLNPFSQIQKSRDSKRKNDLGLIKIKLEDYHGDNNSYPSPPGSCQSSCCVEIACDQTFLAPYLPKFPCEPGGKRYLYCADNVKSLWYKIYTKIEYKEDRQLAISECKDGCLLNNKCYNYGINSYNSTLDNGLRCH